MTDFTTNIDMNVRMMNEKLRVDRNFDILQRDVLIGGKRTHFYFIDGFVQEETIEKLVQFFYSLKESDINTPIEDQHVEHFAENLLDNYDLSLIHI